MVRLVNTGDVMPDEAVGLEPPTPFVSALMAFTARQKNDDEMLGKKIGKSMTAPTDSMRNRILAMSLFPSVGMASPVHRTFPRIKTEGADGSGGDLVYRRGKGKVGFNYQ
jgi:hypothetical protein